MALRRDQMVCDKCGSGDMVDDSYYDVRVYKCWVCGNRAYVDYPKRNGSLVCSRCGDNMDTKNELGYCEECLKLVKLDVEKTKEHSSEEDRSASDKIFIRKSPRRVPQGGAERKRPASLQA
jgi:hypothetical protein